jgi:acyl-CoA thioester hydrolase
MRRVSVPLEAWFHDVDLGGIVWHGHYLRYFEIGRTELLRAVDLDVPRLMEMGVRVVVSSSRCQHHRALAYGERFVVHAGFGILKPAVEVIYEITTPEGQRVAKGRTTLAAVSPDATRLAPVPDEIVAAIEAWTSAEDAR